MPYHYLEKILPRSHTGIQEEIYRKTVKNGIQSERDHKIFYYIIRLVGDAEYNTLILILKQADTSFCQQR